jgi:phosphoribosylformylglycinamidine cyclo-ligase
VAVGLLEPQQVAELVGGVAAGCTDAGCALVGGETAEHPGLMQPGEFDLAGFCVGVVERDAWIDGSAVRAGDAILGLPANGLHANGFSLVRNLVARWDLDLARPYQEQLHLTLGAEAAGEAIEAEPEHALATLGEVLLTATPIYSGAILALQRALRAAGHDLRGLAHITGGGLPGNVPRAMPPALAARVDPTTWRMPSVMRLFGALGGLDDLELRATFNGGLGMIAVVSPEAVSTAQSSLAAAGLRAPVVGNVVASRELGAPDGARYAEVALGPAGG